METVSPLQIKADGQDAIGKFKMEIPGWCEVCEAKKGIAAGPQDVGMQYIYAAGVNRFFKDKLDASVEVTILGRASARLGISCGCYAKLHRQVATIRVKRAPKIKSAQET